jgi:hypothetical protein
MFDFALEESFEEKHLGSYKEHLYPTTVRLRCSIMAKCMDISWGSSPTLHVNLTKIRLAIIPYHKFSSNRLLSPEVHSQLCVGM